MAGYLLPLAAAALAIERLAYIGVSRYPSAFERLVAQHRALARVGPIDAITTAFLGFKLLQGAVFVAWCVAYSETGSPHHVVDTDAVVAGAILVGIGQLLNLRVFYVLGRVGVFYGNHFGNPPRWHTGFPFSLMRHPQYVGACLSIWGIFLVMRFPYPDWYVLPVLETAYYAAGSALER